MSKNINNIINDYNNRIQNVINNFFNSHEDIEDVKQQVYLKIWKNSDKYQQGSLWGWLRKITVNTCYDNLRKNKNNIVYLDNDNENDDLINLVPDKKSGPETLADLSERQKIILNAINTLNEKHKDVIILYDIYELSQEEISQKLNCPVGTVKSRLFNARKQLQTKLKDLID